MTDPHDGGVVAVVCSGPCFALRLDGVRVVVACLAAEHGGLRRGAERLHLVATMDTPLSGAQAKRPACGAGFAVKTYGLRIAVRANTAAILRRVPEHLPPRWRLVDTGAVERMYSFVAPRRRGLHTLYGDIAALSWQSSLDDLLETFESDLRLYVAERAPRHVFLHAGVVGWRGQAILFPGTSMSGKSTLVAELIRAGATYYSDEYAVLDARGRVHPYARPLRLRRAGLSRLRLDPVAALQGRAGRRALPVGLVVLSRYRVGARWRPRPLAASAGALALLDHAVAARHAPARVLSAVGEVAKGARFLVGARGEADETARLILDCD